VGGWVCRSWVRYGVCCVGGGGCVWWGKPCCLFGLVKGGGGGRWWFVWGFFGVAVGVGVSGGGGGVLGWLLGSVFKLQAEQPIPFFIPGLG